MLPLSGAAVVECDGEKAELAGRTGVFDGVTDFAYVPRDAHVDRDQRGRWTVRAAQRARPASAAVPLRARVDDVRSSCAAPVSARDRSTTSRPPTRSTPIG